MSSKTKAELEAEISSAIVEFEKEQFGKAPSEVETSIQGDMIYIQTRGFLSPAEESLVLEPDGLKLFTQIRTRIFERSRATLEKAIEKITGTSIKNLHFDFSSVTGDNFIFVIINKNMEADCYKTN